MSFTAVALLITASSAIRAQTNEAGVEVAIAIRDIELNKDREILGQLVDRAGIGQPRQLLTVECGGRTIANIRTDDAGYFKVRVQRGGMYLIKVGNATRAFRVWMHNTAPPSAARGVLLVRESTGNSAVVRGRRPQRWEGLAMPQRLLRPSEPVPSVDLLLWKETVLQLEIHPRS